MMIILTLQEFQRQWEKIVNVLYEAANDLIFCYPFVVVVEKIEEKKPHFSEKENLVLIEVI